MKDKPPIVGSLTGFWSYCRLNRMQRYILREFVGIILLCLFAATSLFLVFETFDRMRVFIREGSNIGDVLSYLAFKIPLIIQLMMPIAMLIATLISIGRLSQLSEVTAMRACGASIMSLAQPLLYAGALVSVMMFFAGETIVPWATKRGEEIYQLDIRKKNIKGEFNKQDFWYREDNHFYSIGFYDSRRAVLDSISAFDVDENFRFKKRINSESASWNGPMAGWNMTNIVQVDSDEDGGFNIEKFTTLPLVVKDKPADFSKIKWTPDTLSYTELKKRVDKMIQEGMPASQHLVSLEAKVAFPLVNFIVILIAFPFALIPARSGNLAASFVAGVSIGFGYYVVHAVGTSLGTAELIPVTISAWTANILLGCIGAYLMAGAEYN